MLDLFLWLALAAAAAASTPPVPTPAERACRADTDCVLTPLDCCGCSAGGVAVSVNKRSQSRFDRRRQQACGEVVTCVAAISSSWTCTGTPICSAGSCRTAWAIGGACRRDDDCLSVDSDAVCKPLGQSCGPARCIRGACSVVPPSP